MRLRLASAALALIGGLLLLVAGVLELTSGTDTDAGTSADWQRLVALGGYVLALVALAVLGYSLVASAPVWLRIIVGICTPLLFASVWTALVQGIEEGSSGGEAAVWLVAGVLALVLALLERRAAGADVERDRPRH